MKVEIPEESFQFLKDLVAEIKSQSNRMTASPYFYVIQEKEIVVVPDGCGDKTMYLHCDGEFMNEEEVRDWADDQVLDIDELVSDHEEYLTPYEVRDDRVTKEHHNVFFTEKACHKHIEQNHYHFSAPRSYVRHAWRNPEMENLFKAINKIVENNK